MDQKEIDEIDKKIREAQERIDRESAVRATIVEVSDHDSDTSVGTQGTTDTISAEVEKMDLQEGKKKKLSGAQQRKLIKERKMAAGTWTEEKPQKMDRDKQTKVGVKEQTTGSKKGVEKDREGKKRPREVTKTPTPRAFKKPRATGQYSEVASGLRMAVIDRRHPEVTLDQGQADLIQERIVDALDNAASSSSNPLQFARTTFSGGVLWMTCHNEATKTWVKEAVANLGNLWEGADLTAVESKDLPKRPRVLIFIPGQEEEEGVVRPRLERQNPGLRVGGWLLLSKKKEKEGTFWAFSIDEASFSALQKNQFRAFYKLGRVNVKVLKGLDDQGTDKGDTSEPPAQ